MTIIGYIVDVYALLSIPVIIYQWYQSRKQKRLYEQLMLKIYAGKGRNLSSFIARKTKKKSDWYLGGVGEKVFNPVRAFFMENTEVVPLLSKELQQKHDELVRKINGMNQFTYFPTLVESMLNYLYDINVYVTNELKVQ